MLGQKRRQASWTKGVMTFLVALVVGWATLASPSLAVPTDHSSASSHACCPHTDGPASDVEPGCTQQEHHCDGDMACSAPDCARTTGSIAAGITERSLLITRGSGFEFRRRLPSNRPDSFALPIPKQPPKY